MVKLWCSASDGIRVLARHVHRRAFQTCDAGRAGVYLPSEAGTPDTTIERDDADHAGARPISINLRIALFFWMLYFGGEWNHSSLMSRGK